MRRFFVLFCFFSLGTNLFAASSVLVRDETLQANLKEISVFEKQEKFEEAQKAYEKIHKKYALTASQIRKVKQRREAFNLQMIFSKKKTPGSLLYTVKEGDSLFELSKKYKTNPELIKKINRLKEEELIKGTQLKILKAKFQLNVDKSQNRLALYFEKQLIKEYSVTTGANNKTPVGNYKIINKVENPTWYFGDKVIPPGSKKNLLGTRWMGFDKPSYGIHGTVEPESIGRQASLGCVRMLNRDVEELYLLVPLGSSVTITN